MSYSRWSNSRWYTYYHADSGDSYDDQYIDICGVCMFTYKDLKDNFEGCIDKVRSLVTLVTSEEIKELKSYLNEFIADVENDRELKLIKDLQTLPDNQIINFSLTFLETAERQKHLQNWNKERILNHYQDALLVSQTPDSELPLLINYSFKSDTGKIRLERRLKT